MHPVPSGCFGTNLGSPVLSQHQASAPSPGVREEGSGPSWAVGGEDGLGVNIAHASAWRHSRANPLPTPPPSLGNGRGQKQLGRGGSTCLGGGWAEVRSAPSRADGGTETPMPPGTVSVAHPSPTRAPGGSCCCKWRLRYIDTRSGSGSPGSEGCTPGFLPTLGSKAGCPMLLQSQPPEGPHSLAPPCKALATPHPPP